MCSDMSGQAMLVYQFLCWWDTDAQQLCKTMFVALTRLFFSSLPNCHAGERVLDECKEMSFQSVPLDRLEDY